MISVGATLVVLGELDVGAMIAANILSTRALQPISKMSQLGAAFAKASQSMTLQIPIQKSAFIMQLADDPKVPYSRARIRKINEQTLQENDETYALIDQHIARMATREKPPAYKDLFRKGGMYFKVGELVQSNRQS